MEHAICLYYDERQRNWMLYQFNLKAQAIFIYNLVSFNETVRFERRRSEIALELAQDFNNKCIRDGYTLQFDPNYEFIDVKSQFRRPDQTSSGVFALHTIEALYNPSIRKSPTPSPNVLRQPYVQRLMLLFDYPKSHPTLGSPKPPEPPIPHKNPQCDSCLTAEVVCDRKEPTCDRCQEHLLDCKVGLVQHAPKFPAPYLMELRRNQPQTRHDLLRTLFEAITPDKESLAIIIAETIKCLTPLKQSVGTSLTMCTEEVQSRIENETLVVFQRPPWSALIQTAMDVSDLYNKPVGQQAKNMYESDYSTVVIAPLWPHTKTISEYFAVAQIAIQEAIGCEKNALRVKKITGSPSFVQSLILHQAATVI